MDLVHWLNDLRVLGVIALGTGVALELFAVRQRAGGQAQPGSRREDRVSRLAMTLMCCGVLVIGLTSCSLLIGR